MNTPSKKALTIKEWDLTDRPREKLLNLGVPALSNAELLALVIGSGLPGMSAVAIMKKLLRDADHQLQKLAQKSIPELLKIKGIGPAKAVKIKAALGLATRYSIESTKELRSIQTSHTAFELLHTTLGYLDHEEFWVLYLNQANRLLGQFQLSKGGISQTVVDVRLLFKRAIEWNATAIILAHNHPSGNLTPSASDKNVTQKIKKAADLLDIRLLDHIIISAEKYLSFADKQLL